MNINISNFQNLNVFQHKKVALKFQTVRLSNTADKIEEKQEKDKSRCSATISEEAKTLLEESKEENKKSKDNVKPEDKERVIGLENFTIMQAEGTDNFRGEYRLKLAAYNEYKPGSKNQELLSFSGLANEYDKMKKEIESQYSGEKLERELNKLDEDYKNTLDYVAEVIIDATEYWGMVEGEKDIERGIESILGKSMSEMNAILDELGLDKNKSLRDNIDAIVKYLDQRKDKSVKE